MNGSTRKNVDCCRPSSDHCCARAVLFRSTGGQRAPFPQKSSIPTSANRSYPVPNPQPANGKGAAACSFKIPPPLNGPGVGTRRTPSVRVWPRRVHCITPSKTSVLTRLQRIWRSRLYRAGTRFLHVIRENCAQTPERRAAAGRSALSPNKKGASPRGARPFGKMWKVDYSSSSTFAVCGVGRRS